MPVSATIYNIEEMLENQDQQDFRVKLEGAWQFYEEELLLPHEIETHSGEDKGKTVILPSSFKEQVGVKNTYGTYQMTIRIPTHLLGQALAIHIPYEYSAYTIFVDGVEIARNGTVGSGLETHQSEMAPKIGYFFAQSNDIDIVIQVSSFNHIRGGLENAIYFGDASTVTKKMNNKMMIDLFIISGIFIIGLFIVSFVSFSKEEFTFLIFGVFCLLIASRSVFADPFYYTILFENITWLWGTRLEYLLTVASSWVFVLLLYRWHKEFSLLLMKILSAIHFALVIIIFVTQPIFFQALFFNVFYLTVPIFVYFYLISIIYRGIRSKNQYTLVNGLGIIFIFIAFFNDFAIGKGWYQFYTLMLPATGLYVLLHMIQMSRNFSRMMRTHVGLNEELLTLNASLDEQVHHRTIELQKANELLKNQAEKDSLTGIPNRRKFNEFIGKAFKESLEKETPLSILMLDIDQFKKYNDHFGHIKGDWLLQEVVKVIDQQLGPEQFFARYGGEEFAIVLPNTLQKEAYVVAESIRKAVEEAAFDHPKGRFGILTFSVGVSTMDVETTYPTEVALIDAADQKLYKAKQSGRNLVL